MQIPNKYYNPELHDQYNAISLKQPFADDLVRATYTDDDGMTYGAKSCEVRSRQTSYRGDVLVCSSKQPEIIGYQSGVTLGIVELYECKPVSEFTADDWDKTRVPKDERQNIKKGYGWFFRNPRRVVEMPVKGSLGIYKVTMPKGDVTEYPTLVELDEKTIEENEL